MGKYGPGSKIPELHFKAQGNVASTKAVILYLVCDTDLTRVYCKGKNCVARMIYHGLLLVCVYKNKLADRHHHRQTPQCS